MKKDYFIGLDIGTTSVGLAATDENYNIINLNGKDIFLSRIFKESQTAKERRAFRCSRRLNERSKNRLKILRELFSDEINKVDENFYKQLDDSALLLQDKEVKLKYTLFNDKEFNDKDYHKRFPTIFHLRKYLMQTTKKDDIRLYFLALNDIFKNRGHFLFENQNFDDNNLKNLIDLEDEFKSAIENSFVECEDLLNINYKDIFDILKDDKIKDKFKQVKYLLNEKINDKKLKKQLEQIFRLMILGDAKLADIFVDENLKDVLKNFNFNNFDEKSDEYLSILGEERFYFIDAIKKMYDNLQLNKILGDSSSFSEAQVKLYESHKNDLKKLKEFVKKYDSSNYKNYFTLVDKENNYAKYIGTDKKSKQKYSVKKCTYDEF